MAQYLDRYCDQDGVSPITPSVAVIGAGPAGSAVALQLASRGVGPVLLAEASDFKGERIGESVPPDFRRLLVQLGVLERFLGEGHLRCLGSASSWGAAELGFNDFIVHPQGTGWHLDRTRFDAFLAQAAEEKGVRLCRGWRFARSVPKSSGGHRLTFQVSGGSDRTVEAAVVVDATGRQARFARFAGGARRQFADRLTCIAGRFADTGHTALGQSTWLEAVDYGWWYAAGLPGERLLVSVASDPRICRRRQLNQPRKWLGHLAHTRHLGARLHGCAFAPDSLAVYSAASSCIEPMHGGDWVAVGDAASAFDPLSSQGIYQAVASGLEAGDAIAEHLAGDSASLARYAAGRSQTYADYLKLRSHLYKLEGRWPESPFWSARQGPVPEEAGLRVGHDHQGGGPAIRAPQGQLQVF